jgi:small subunit ribosomal protein S6
LPAFLSCDKIFAWTCGEEQLMQSQSVSRSFCSQPKLWASPWKDKERRSAGMTEQMNQYELVYIIQPELDNDETKAVDERISQTIANQNGQIVSTEVWGQRKLAYPIKRFFEGYYILHNVQMPPSGVIEVERALRLNEDVIRFLVVRTN